MGAELWYHETPGHRDPAAALADLQARFLAEHYDLPNYVRERLESVREAVRSCEVDDEYGLLGFYREELAMLEGVIAKPLPEDPPARIALLREVCASSGEGIGNVLDVTGIADERGAFVAERLSDAEMTRLIGTTRPSLDQAVRAIHRIAEEIRRAECVCFPCYDGDPEHPTGWYFVGNTLD